MATNYCGIVGEGKLKCEVVEAERRNLNWVEQRKDQVELRGKSEGVKIWIALQEIKRRRPRKIEIWIRKAVLNLTNHLNYYFLIIVAEKILS